MRPLTIMDVPITDPYTCIRCGAAEGSPNRRHFVDLGVEAHLKRTDEHGMAHMFDGVIYLCNLCMMNTIGDYLGKLFDFINNQEIGYSLTQAQRQEQLDTLENEIFTLREQLNKRDDEVKDLRIQLQEYENRTAEELVGSLVRGRDNEDASGSDSDATGTAENPDGNDSATQSPDFTADSLFQLHHAIALDNNS